MGCWIRESDCHWLSPSSTQVRWPIHKSLLFLQALNSLTSSNDALCKGMRREGRHGGQRRGLRGRQRRGTDERDKVSMGKSQADGRGARRFTQKAQTGLIRNSSNPSMMLTGRETHRKEELRQAERPTKTSPAGLKLKEKTGAASSFEANQKSLHKTSI